MYCSTRCVCLAPAYWALSVARDVVGMPVSSSDAWLVSVRSVVRGVVGVILFDEYRALSACTPCPLTRYYRSCAVYHGCRCHPVCAGCPSHPVRAMPAALDIRWSRRIQIGE
ncbi:hypothetical protein EDB85DRAFT_1460124 [Lactarius pseudohatsudake]|nr:hypothetical protein EDB85DRAFT_1460124 [Lactarius pseudohatsudake]